jgi:hypothetical protein
MFVSFSFGREPIGCAPGIYCNWPRAGAPETRIEELYSRFRPALLPPDAAGETLENSTHPIFPAVQPESWVLKLSVRGVGHMADAD